MYWKFIKNLTEQHFLSIPVLFEVYLFGMKYFLQKPTNLRKNTTKILKYRSYLKSPLIKIKITIRENYTSFNKIKITCMDKDQYITSIYCTPTLSGRFTNWKALSLKLYKYNFHFPIHKDRFNPMFYLWSVSLRDWEVKRYWNKAIQLAFQKELRRVPTWSAKITSVKELFYYLNRKQFTVLNTYSGVSKNL